MIFNSHSSLSGQHAFLSASKYHWSNYDDEKLDQAYLASLAVKRGNELHAFAHEAIKLGVKLPKTSKTLNMYINDAIGFRMASEQVLYYSDVCFGTADAISFRRNKLRIHDLKTGVSSTSERQLEIYAALFCLEYRFKPCDIEIELRIYQTNEIRVYDADPDTITHLMDKIVSFDKRIANLRMEANL
jgi:hypothetical protein